MGKPKKIKSEKSTAGPKAKGLFDHVNEIRNSKNPNYFESLTDKDKKSFNHYMICRFLSMDPSCIYEVSYLSKIFDKMDSKSFYRVCCALIPRAKYTPYIKSKNKKPNADLVGYVCLRFDESLEHAAEYCKVLGRTESGLENLREICRAFGKTDKEIERMMADE